jgi:copper chaperone NosL
MLKLIGKKPDRSICKSNPPAIRLVAALPFLVLCLSSGCSPSENRPAEILSEDMCAHCRMAISNLRFASEIILESGEVLKFDDLGCLAAYQSSHSDRNVTAVFVKDYETKNWLLWQKAVIVTTGVFTPMGSGEVAFGDSARALEFKRQHPAEAE